MIHSLKDFEEFCFVKFKPNQLDKERNQNVNIIQKVNWFQSESHDLKSKQNNFELFKLEYEKIKIIFRIDNMFSDWIKNFVYIDINQQILKENNCFIISKLK